MGLLGRGGPATRRARSLKSGVLSLPDTHAHADPHPALWWWLLWSSPPPSRRAACARPERGEHAHAAVGDDAPRHRARRIAHARSTRKDGNSGRVRDGGACGLRGAGTGRRARGSTREARAARGRGRSRQAQTRAAQHAHPCPLTRPARGHRARQRALLHPPFLSRTGRGRAPVATTNRVFGPRSPRRRTSGRRGLRGHRRPAS